MKYELHTALREDVDAGAIWLGTPEFTSRSIVKVRNPQRDLSVHCEVKMIDRFFLRAYAERANEDVATPTEAIFVSAWYRKQLGIEASGGKIDLEVTAAESIKGKILACLHHPQVVVRIATYLGLWSVFLGVVGIILGIISLVPHH